MSQFVRTATMLCNNPNSKLKFLPPQYKSYSCSLTDATMSQFVRTATMLCSTSGSRPDITLGVQFPEEKAAAAAGGVPQSLDSSSMLGIGGGAGGRSEVN